MKLDARQFLGPLPRCALAGQAEDLLRPYRFAGSASAPEASPASERPERETLAAALRHDNRRFGHPRADQLAESLAAGARVVVTGQQPGLFGGPLYSWSKAVAAHLWAEELARDADAVALFWIASDDHDHNEIARAWRPGLDEALRLERAPDSDLRPVGPQALGAGIASAIERLCGTAGGPVATEWRGCLERIYAPETTFTEAFARLLVELMGERCPLLLDAANPVVKQLQAPHLARLLERRSEMHEAFEVREREITDRGFPLQVRPRREALPLFVHDRDGRRRRVLDRAGALIVQGAEELEDGDLGALLAAEPERFSASALARPAIQDALLGTDLFLVGPGELAYAAQAAALYPVLEVPAPALALRPQLLLLDRRRQQQLEELGRLGVGLELLLAAEDELEAAIAAAAGDDPIAECCARLRAGAGELAAVATRVDAQLSSPAAKTTAQIERAVAALEKRVSAARARRDETVGRRALELRELLFPGGRLQERVVCCAHFPLRHRHVTEALVASLELDPSVIRVLDPELPPCSGAGSRSAEAERTW